MSSNHVQTLANSIIGTSILAMPYCFSKCGVILSIILLILSTITTRACCHYLIKASIVTRRKNMELLGFYIFGNSGKTLVEISVIGFLMGTCIAFFVVIGDLCPILFAKIFNVQNLDRDALRRWLICLVTVTCIIPLSFQKSIQSLSFVCKASIGFYVCLTLKTVVESFSRFQTDDNWTSNIKLWDSSGIIQCIPIFTMAMSCQMQLFEVYENISSFDRIRQNIFHATLICLVVYTVIGFFGYVAFYNQNLSGNILVNFQPSLANDIITFGFILSIACSFPLVLFPCRSSLASLLHRKVHHSEISPYIPESRYKPLTLFIIISTMIVGILVPSVEVIIGFVGSTIGTMICIIFPATCFVKIMQRNTTEKAIAQCVIVLGFIVMILGTYSNLNALDVAKSGSHLEVHQVPPAALHQNDIPVDVPDQVKQPDIADPKEEIKEKEKEIIELKASKDKLEQQVLEMKEELVKQNEETQKLVLKKFDEIAEKVDKIEKQSQDSVESKKVVPGEGEKKNLTDLSKDPVIYVTAVLDEKKIAKDPGEIKKDPVKDLGEKKIQEDPVNEGDRKEDLGKVQDNQKLQGPKAQEYDLKAPVEEPILQINPKVPETDSKVQNIDPKALNSDDKVNQIDQKSSNNDNDHHQIEEKAQEEVKAPIIEQEAENNQKAQEENPKPKESLKAPQESLKAPKNAENHDLQPLANQQAFNDTKAHRHHHQELKKFENELPEAQAIEDYVKNHETFEKAKEKLKAHEKALDDGPKARQKMEAEPSGDKNKLDDDKKLDEKDPIIKLLQSQAPLSYQVGEKLMEEKKNITSKEKKPENEDLGHKDVMMEMRKRRQVDLNDVESLFNDNVNLQLNSVITRDLKAYDEE